MTDNSLPTRSDRLESETKRKKRGVALFLRDLLVIFVVALLISFLIKTFLIRSFYIPSGSMETTLLVNDRIIVNQLEPGLIPSGSAEGTVWIEPLFGSGPVFKVQITATGGSADPLPYKAVVPSAASDHS